MSLNVAHLAEQMVAAALPILVQHSSDVQSFAKTEFAKIAQTLAGIEEQTADGQINQAQAAILLDMQKGASRNVLLALKGLDMLTVEEAINAALGVVKTVVDTALGFALL